MDAQTMDSLKTTGPQSSKRAEPSICCLWVDSRWGQALNWKGHWSFFPSLHGLSLGGASERFRRRDPYMANDALQGLLVNSAGMCTSSHARPPPQPLWAFKPLQTTHVFHHENFISSVLSRGLASVSSSSGKRCSKVCVQNSLGRKKDKVFYESVLRNQWVHKTRLSEGKSVLTRLLSTWGFGFAKSWLLRQPKLLLQTVPDVGAKEGSLRVGPTGVCPLRKYARKTRFRGLVVTHGSPHVHEWWVPSLQESSQCVR